MPRYERGAFATWLLWYIYLKRIFKEKIRKTERKGFAQMQTMETKTSKDYLIAWAGTRTQVSSL